MKRPVLLVLFLCILSTCFSTTYYSTNNTSPNSTSSWHTNRNGSGSTPSGFTNDGDIFIIQAGHTMTTTANWKMNGNNEKVIIEAGATLEGDDKITVDIFQIYDGGTYIHNVGNSAFPGDNSRLLAATSTVELRDWSGGTELPSPTTWGNLTINLVGFNSNINMAGDLTDIAGNFIIRSTGNSGKEFRLASAQDYTLTIGGNLVIEDGILETSQSNGSADQTIIINGSFIQSGGTFTRSNNNIFNPLEIQFNGTNSAFTQTAGTLTGTYINWKVNTGKKLVLNNNLPVALLRSLTVNGTLDLGTFSISGLGLFTLNSGALLRTAHASGLVGGLSLTGLITLNTGGSYEFLSATTSPFPLLATTISATNLTIGADVTINKNVTVSGTLTLNSGKLIIPSSNTITVSSGNTIAGTGFSATKHIATQVNTLTGAKGSFRLQNFSGTRSIPTGNGTYYLPVTLTATGTNDFTITVFNGLTWNGQPNGTAFTTAQKKATVDAIWQVNRNSGTGDVMMQLAWPAALEGSTFQTLPNSQIGIAHYGTAWEAGFGSGDQILNTATRSAIISFSPFGVGKAGVPLPLKFGEIKALPKNNGIEVDWSSLSESNLDHYEIERSTDGRNFISIGQVRARGNNDDKVDYTYQDNSTADAVYFYRIKGVDIDAKWMYSSIVKITMSQQPVSGIVIYPNPVTGHQLSYQVANLIKGQYTLRLFNTTGQEVYGRQLNHQGGSIAETIVLPPTIKTGVYTLQLTGTGIQLPIKCLVQ
jgi:hypothetical protein